MSVETILSSKEVRGFSSYFSIGKGHGWHLQKDGPSIRINLGIVSFAFILIDIFGLLKKLMDELKQKDVNQKNIEEKQRDLSALAVILERQKDTMNENTKEYQYKFEFSERQRAELEKQLAETIKNNESLELKDAEINDLGDDLTEAKDQNSDLEEELAITKEKLLKIQSIETELLKQALTTDKEINRLEALVLRLEMESSASNFF